MMANTDQKENSPKPGSSGFQLKRRGSEPEDEAKHSRSISNLTMTDASFLPTEILIKIFLYMDLDDIKAAGLCCRRWLEITNGPEFISKRIFKIRGGLLDSEHPAAKAICANKIENLYLHDLKFGDIDEFFEQIGANLKMLTMNAVDFVNDRLLTFKHFTNLQSLKVCGSKLRNRRVKSFVYPPFVGLSRLKELKLSMNDSRVDRYILGCTLHTDFLEKLTLKVGDEFEVQILKILDKQAGTLNILNLSLCSSSQRGPDYNEWKRISSKLNLKELSLKGDMNYSIVTQMLKNVKSLCSLRLHGYSIVKDEHLSLIVKELPQLERLFLIVCDIVTDVGVRQLGKLSKLTVLGLDDCVEITSNAIRSIIGQGAGTRLQELHMRYLDHAEKDIVCYCAQNLKNVKVLDITGCGDAVTPESVNEIFKYQKNLRDLRLDECEKLTDFGMLGHELERLSLRECGKLSDETLCGISAPHLKFLDIRRCSRMTSCGISALVKNCPAIEEIAFTYSKEMNEEVVDVLTNGLRSLRTLFIENCSEELKQGTANWKRMPDPITLQCDLSVILKKRKFI